LNDALRNPDIRAIFCARGGYGCLRLLPCVDYAAIAADPKIIIGFSDCTALLSAVHSQSRIVTFHGPMPGTETFSERNFSNMLKHLKGEKIHFARISESPLNRMDQTAIEEGSGLLYGGCLSILASLAGTEYLPETKHRLIFLEEIKEAPYRIDRMLTHLILTGFFSGASGVLLGDFIGCTQREDDLEPSLTLDEIFNYLGTKTNIPVIKGYPIGHGNSNWTLPFGVQFAWNKNELTQVDNSVS
jgi:muramoyltetrapeptide carboxypeptidase